MTLEFKLSFGKKLNRFINFRNVLDPNEKLFKKYFIFVLFCFSVVDAYRKQENDAAVKIQSWFRGCRVRAYIR